MNALKAYVHTLFPCGKVVSTEHDHLADWQNAVAGAWAQSASHVILHAGFEPLSDERVGSQFAGLQDGIYFTTAAVNIRPNSWLSPVEIIDELPGFFRSGASVPVVDALVTISEAPAEDAVELPKRRGRPPKDRGDENAVARAANVAPQQFADLSHYLAFLWDSLRESDRDVLRGRWGYDGEARTFQQLADGRTPPVARARIQQIEVIALQRAGQLVETQDMVTRLQSVEAVCALPVPLEDLPKLDAWFDASSVAAPGFTAAIKALSNKTLDVINVDDTLYLVPFTKRIWNEAIGEAGKILQDLARTETSATQAVKRLGELLSDSSEKYGELLWKELEENCHVAVNIDGTTCLVAYGHGVKEAIKAVLFEAKDPLHRDEIVAQVRLRSAKSVSELTITNAVPEVGLLMARGYYGLRQHIPLSDGDIAALVDAAEELLLTDPTHRHWSTTEMCRAMRDNDLFDSEYLGPYVLGACLRHNGTKLEDLKRGVWAPPTTIQGERIKIREFIIEMLEASRRPMSTDELKRELQERRGLSATFQIQPRDRLFRLGTATWGLLDRDLPLTNEQLAPYLDALKAHLLRSGQGIHVSEVLPLLVRAGFNTQWVQDPELFLTLSQRTGAMRVTMTRYLVLSEWSDERRVTPAQAVLAVVRHDPRRTSAELATAASVSAGREVSPEMVRSVLNNGGFGYRQAEKRWVEQSSSDPDD